MDVGNSALLAQYFEGLQRRFEGGLASDPALNNLFLRVSSQVNSTTERENYPFQDEVENLRPWVGAREVTQLAAYTYELTNLPFERTLAIPLQKLRDDQFGVFPERSESLGRAAAVWPNTLVFDALANGASTVCHDGQYFFDTDHTVNGATYSNYVAGGGTAWYLLDTRRSLSPIIFQRRQMPTFWSNQSLQSDEAINNDRLLYGADARGVAGYGLFHTAYRRHDSITESTLGATIQAMSSLTNDQGRLLGIRPNILLVGVARYLEALKLTEQVTLATGEQSFSNIMVKQFGLELLYCPLLP